MIPPMSNNHFSGSARGGNYRNSQRTKKGATQRAAPKRHKAALLGGNCLWFHSLCGRRFSVLGLLKSLPSSEVFMDLPAN